MLRPHLEDLACRFEIYHFPPAVLPSRRLEYLTTQPKPSEGVLVLEKIPPLKTTITINKTTGRLSSFKPSSENHDRPFHLPILPRQLRPVSSPSRKECRVPLRSRYQLPGMRKFLYGPTDRLAPTLVLAPKPRTLRGEIPAARKSVRRAAGKRWSRGQGPSSFER